MAVIAVIGMGGIGSVVARVLQEAGHTVIAGRHRPSAGPESGFHELSVDVTDFGSCREFFTAAKRHAGKVDAVVNCFGSVRAAPAVTEDAASAMQTFNVHVGGVVNVSRVAASAFIKSGGGAIINFASVAAQTAIPVGALASGAFMANQTIAGLVNESNFNSIYQQGENVSLFVVNVDEHCLLVAIFKSETGVGVIKYYAVSAVKRIARWLKVARKRAPGKGLDLSVLNVADPQEMFRKKGA